MNASLRKTLVPLASLKLTVALLCATMFLVFAGTLAQVDQNIWLVVARYFRSFAVWIDFQIFAPRSLVRIPGGFPFPGGFLLGALLAVNLICAHIAVFKFNRKRAGIMLLHAGIILLIVGEFVTGIFSVEGNMTIDQGGSSNYVEDIRTCELAIMQSKNDDMDHVIVVPLGKLRGAAKAKNPGENTIVSAALPFDIQVDQWMDHSHILGPMQTPPALRDFADQGFGKQVAAVTASASTGVSGAQVDLPSAYITLLSNGARLGRWLVSLNIDEPQPVVVGDKTYLIALRFKRTYKPYTLELIKFSHDKFIGTEKARNFSSNVRVVDPSHHVNFEALISMNNPLRYAGETFYQSAFKPNDSGTILQVVQNPGWLLPYIACIMVSLGMMVHFLDRFLTAPRPKK